MRKTVLALLCCSTVSARDLPPGVAWIHEFREPISSSVVAAQGKSFLMVGEELCALRAEDGKVAWKTRTGRRGKLEWRDGCLISHDGWNKQFYAPETGQLIWQFDHDQCEAQFTPGRAWYVSKGQMFARNLRSGQVLWRRPLPKDLLRFWPDRGGLFASFQGSKMARIAYTGRLQALPWSADEMQKTPAGWLVKSEAETSLVDGEGQVLWNKPNLFDPLLADGVVVGTDHDLLGLELASGRRLWSRQVYSEPFALGRFLVLDKFDQLVFCDTRTGATVKRFFGTHPRAVASPGLVTILAWPGTLTRYRQSDFKELERWPKLVSSYEYTTKIPPGSYGEGRTYHPSHTTLAVLGKGAGEVIFEGPPQLELVEHPDGLLVRGHNLRQVELELYSGGKLRHRRRLKLPAGDPGSFELCKFALKHGVYQVLARSRGVVARLQYKL